MATINNTFIALAPRPNNQVEVTVVCEIGVPASEITSLFRLECSVLGNDLLRDEVQFSYPSQTFGGTDAGPSRRFERTVSRGTLNEDRVGRDEVVGQLTLHNLTLNKVIKKRTNVVEVV